jgi:hypothetical protein
LLTTINANPNFEVYIRTRALPPLAKRGCFEAPQGRQPVHAGPVGKSGRGCGRSPGAGGQGIDHHASVFMLVAEQMAHFVLQGSQQVHSVLLALVAGRDELGIVMGRRIDESARAGGVDKAVAELCKEVEALLAG